MQDLYFKAQFVRNFKAPEWYLKQLEDEFMARRNFAVELLNDKYETWNTEYDAIDPDNKGCDYSEYCKFIAEKQDEYLNIANDKMLKTNYILLKTDPNESCDIYCVLRQNEKAWMRLTLKPYNA